MAVVVPTIVEMPYDGDKGVHIVTWTPMLNGDTGLALEMPGSADRSVQVTGTFGVGGTMVLKGTNEGATPAAATNFLGLTDPQGNAISKTASAIEQVLELTRFSRPEITAGDGATSLTVTMIVKRSRR